MTASFTPEPTAHAPVNGVGPGFRTPEAPPPRRWIGPVLGALGSLVAVIVGAVVLFGLLGPGVVESSAVASEIQGRITTGQAICSEDLPAEVGASISCSILGGGGTTQVRATVTAVDGDDVTYQLEEVG